MGAVAVSEDGSGGSVYTGYVATSTRVPYVFNTTNKQTMCRSAHFARENITRLRCGFPHWFVDTSSGGAIDGAEKNIGTAHAQIEASIEYPAGTFTRLTFAGATQGDAAPGVTLFTDDLGIRIPFGGKFWVRTWYACADGIIFSDPAPAENQAEAGVACANRVMGGAISGSTGVLYCPAVIVGATRRPSVGIIGDSRTAGTQDTGDDSLNMGDIARCIGNDLAYANFACPTDSANWFSTKGAKRAALLQYASHIVCAYGFNDLGTGANDPTDCHAHLQTIYGLTNIAGKPTYQTTVYPGFMTSTDGFITEANQTINANNTSIQAFNATLRGGVANVTDVIDTASVIESKTTQGKIIAPWGKSLTPDSAHLNRRGRLLLQSSGILHAGLFTR